MSVSGITNLVSANTGATAPEKEALGRDDFLNLLVTQLQNQDPMDPMESAEFSAQLAQFSSLEQLTNLNDGMKSLIGTQATAVQSQAVGFIGRSVKADGATLQLASDAPVDCTFDLSADADKVRVSIYDLEGRPVKTIDAAQMESGEGKISWDGKNDSGQAVPDGLYTFEVAAINAEGGTIDCQPFIAKKITGVVPRDGGAVLMAGDIEIPMDTVLQYEKSETENDGE